MTASPQPDPPRSPRADRSASIGLIVVVVVVMGGAILLAHQLGSGASTIIAGFTAIFFALGVGGGSLRADLRKVAWYGPLTALSASVPRVVAEQNKGLALALVCVVIFVAGLLPVLGKNYAQAGLGLGLATMLGFALQTDTGSGAQTIGAAFVGVVFVVLLRIVLKIRDPSDVTRDLVAATLTQEDPDFDQAYTMWLRDTPTRWVSEVLRTAVGYRAVRSVLTADEGGRADRRAVQVAALIASREPGQPPSSTNEASADEAAGTATSASGALTRALQALDRIEHTARDRDTTPLREAPPIRRALARASIRSVLTWQSEILRHALRTTLGVLITFLLAWATIGSRDPLVTSMATAAFAILQISWTQSLTKAKQRLAGVAAGAGVMALALWILPEQALLPFSLLAALAGLWLIVTDQVLSIGCFVVVSVGMNVVGRDLDPTRTLLEYVLLLLAAVTIGLLLGFVVVPHLSPQRLDERVRRTQTAAAELLRCVARQALADETSRRYALTNALQNLRTAVENLGSPLDRHDELAGVSAAQCTSLATRFETLAIVGVLESGPDRLTPEVLSAAADSLDPVSQRPQDDDSGTGSDFVRLAQWTARSSTDLLNAHCGPIDPLHPPTPPS